MKNFNYEIKKKLLPFKNGFTTTYVWTWLENQVLLWNYQKDTIEYLRKHFHEWIKSYKKYIIGKK